MIFCEYTAPIPGNALSCSFVAEFKSTKSVLEAGADAVWLGFGAGLVAVFDCALTELRNTTLSTADITIEKIRLTIKVVLLYCGFFSFLAARYPAARASDSDMYFPFFVLP